jgi:hypothetical protein
MSSATAGVVRKLKNSVAGDYLWQPAIDQRQRHPWPGVYVAGGGAGVSHG